MADWKLPADVRDWVESLADALHARVRHRLAAIFLGVVFAVGRRTVSKWIAAAGVSDDWKAHYYFLGSVGRRVPCSRLCVSMSFDETMLARSCKHGAQHCLGHAIPPPRFSASESTARDEWRPRFVSPSDNAGGSPLRTGRARALWSAGTCPRFRLGVAFADACDGRRDAVCESFLRPATDDGR